MLNRLLCGCLIAVWAILLPVAASADWDEDEWGGISWNEPDMDDWPAFYYYGPGFAGLGPDYVFTSPYYFSYGLINPYGYAGRITLPYGYGFYSYPYGYASAFRPVYGPHVYVHPW